MTSDRPDSSDDRRNAIARAAHALSSSDPRAHVFFEERTDTRLNLASSGLRNEVTTRACGGTIASRRSIHATGPDFLESALRWKPWETAEMVDRDHKIWVAKVEAAVAKEAASAALGRRQPAWSAKLVEFHQEVWVGRPGHSVVHDVRRGSRLELRVRFGDNPRASAVNELVPRSDSSPPIREAFARAFDRAEQREATSGTCEPGITTAVFAPGAGGIVAHELIGHALEGDVVARGRTWIGERGVSAPRVSLTVVDDPRRGRGAWLIDDEGVPTGETILVDRGIRAGLLLDSASASALGRASTGHGRRSSYMESVRPRMGCTFIESGTDDPDDILRSTRTGVFIRRLIGGHTDPISGRATFVVSDSDRIVDGRLAEPLDAFVLELDGPESWGSIDRVAHDLAFDTCIGSCVRDGQPMAVSVGAPTIRIGVVIVRS